LYSGRGFLHRGKLLGHTGSACVQNWDVRAAADLCLTLTDQFETVEGTFYAVWRDRVYHLERCDGVLRPAETEGTPLQDFPSRSALDLRDAKSGRRRGSSRAVSDAERDAFFSQLLKPLIAWSLGGTDAFRHSVTPQAGPGQARTLQLFLFVRSPESFHLAPGGPGAEMGYTLYHLIQHSAPTTPDTEDDSRSGSPNAEL